MSTPIAVREPGELLVEIANTLATLDSLPSRVWICEGPDDVDVVEFHDPGSLVYAAGKREVVIAAAEELARSSRPGKRWESVRLLLVGLVDRDYVLEPAPDRVRVTTTCSMEGDLLQAAGESVVRGLILGIQPADAKALTSHAVRVADQFGALRELAYRRRTPARLQGFPVAHACQATDVDWAAVKTELRRRHPDWFSDLDSLLSDAELEGRRPVQNCARSNGHDLIHLLHHLVSAHPRLRGQVSVAEIRRTLVTAADPEALIWLTA